MSRPRTAVIAGASGDLGKAIAARLKDAGFRTIGLARSKISSSSFDDACQAVDLGDRKALAATVTQLFADCGEVSLVVNAAGAYSKTLQEGLDPVVFRDNVAVAENILMLFTEQMKDTAGARIVTISSIDALYPNINSFSYSVAKSAIRTLVQLYKKQFRATRLNYDLILPGAVHTRMRGAKTEDKNALVQPEDVAATCLYLSGLSGNVATDEIVLYPKSFSFSQL
jgi:NADP-dependent 3-hydroxy acid dehydrogenase YdfG